MITFLVSICWAFVFIRFLSTHWTTSVDGVIDTVQDNKDEDNAVGQ